MTTPDGHSVLFRANGLPYLYVRINAEKTINVAKDQRTTPDASSPLITPRAVGITPDGSKVMFSSRTELTDDASTGELEGVPNQSENIYLYDVSTEKLTDLTIDNKPIDERRGAGVIQVLRTSEDFSYVYFVATGNLAPGATSGELNIYVWHKGKTTYIGSNPDGAPEQGYRVDATPDGKHFIFLSSTNQTAYDSEGKLMVYKYDYGDAVQCVSCRPSGTPPSRPAASAFNENMISNDGSRVFFVTADKLVPQASNGVQNVYEYENGEPHLMTPGDTEDPIALLGASESGDDVFLVTTEELAKGEGRAWGGLRRPRQCAGTAGFPLGRMPGRKLPRPPHPASQLHQLRHAVVRSDHQGRGIGAEERQGRHRPDPCDRARRRHGLDLRSWPEVREPAGPEGRFGDPWAGAQTEGEQKAPAGRRIQDRGRSPVHRG